MTTESSGSAALPTVGFVGVGSIGRPICLNLAKSGFTVIAYDASPEARARLEGTPVEVAGSLAEVARRAEVCVLRIAVLCNRLTRTSTDFFPA